MTVIAVTGVGGFVGMHVRAVMAERGDTLIRLPLGSRFDASQACNALEKADRVIHLAAVIRGSENEIVNGNELMTGQLLSALRACAQPPSVMTYASTVAVDRSGAYGQAKRRAGERLAAYCRSAGVVWDEVLLPNLFGEFGRPDHNSVVATFCHRIARGLMPEVIEDRELDLLHGQDAAERLLGVICEETSRERRATISVSQIRDRLMGMNRICEGGEIPDIAAKFDRDLFNTLRSARFPERGVFPLTVHSDERGGFFEGFRSRGGSGQTSVSTTNPGVVRGEHFHRRKVERFLVIEGEARIGLRPLGGDLPTYINVSGETPLVVDIPTLVVHNLENVGTGSLTTLFWTDDLFDPKSPDTVPDKVAYP